jgi:elongation factor P
MATTSDIKKGMCIEFNHDTYIIIEFQHVKPGKGNAFVRTKIKSLTTGKVLDNTFSAGHKVDDVRIERRQYQFLYEMNDRLHFMNQETYEQVEIAKDFLDGSQFLKEGETCDVIFHAEKEILLAVQMPQYVYLEVTYVEPGLKGDTATNTLTPAEVETGAEVRVPLFINIGDTIKIDTESGAYMERHNKN